MKTPNKILKKAKKIKEFFFFFEMYNSWHFVVRQIWHCCISAVRLSRKLTRFA
jgi:hypothetical protein